MAQTICEYVSALNRSTQSDMKAENQFVFALLS